MSENPMTLEFVLMAGKKLPKEYNDAVLNGYFEAFREPVPGGVKLIMAKKIMALVNPKKRVNVFLLDKMPPESLLLKDLPPQENVTLTKPATMQSPKTDFVGTYGIADGRKFLFIGGETKKGPGRPPKQKAA